MGRGFFCGSQLEYLHFEEREECERTVIIWMLRRQLMGMSQKMHASECCLSHIPVFVRLLIFQTGTNLLKLLLPGVQWAYLLMTFISHKRSTCPYFAYFQL